MNSLNLQFFGGRGSSSISNKNKFESIKNAFERSGREPEEDSFFGKVYKTSNNYFYYEHVKDSDNISLVVGRENIKNIKDNLVLIVGNDKMVYLKDWNITPVSFDRGSVDGYAVKLNRKYFKTYTVRTPFENVYFEKDETFDDLKKIAKKQNNTQYRRAKHAMDKMADLRRYR